MDVGVSIGIGDEVTVGVAVGGVVMAMGGVVRTATAEGEGVSALPGPPACPINSVAPRRTTKTAPMMSTAFFFLLNASSRSRNDMAVICPVA
jgi:hypothetical protein